MSNEDRRFNETVEEEKENIPNEKKKDEEDETDWWHTSRIDFNTYGVRKVECRIFTIKIRRKTTRHY